MLIFHDFGACLHLKRSFKVKKPVTRLEVGRYRQHTEHMELCEYSRSRTFLDFGQRSFAC